MQLQQLQLPLLSSIINPQLEHINKKIHIFYSPSHTADFYAISDITRFGPGMQSDGILTTIALKTFGR
jgi:hypothetical protein